VAGPLLAAAAGPVWHRARPGSRRSQRHLGAAALPAIGAAWLGAGVGGGGPRWDPASSSASGHGLALSGTDLGARRWAGRRCSARWRQRRALPAARRRPAGGPRPASRLGVKRPRPPWHGHGAGARGGVGRPRPPWHGHRDGAGARGRLGGSALASAAGDQSTGPWAATATFVVSLGLLEAPSPSLPASDTGSDSESESERLQVPGDSDSDAIPSPRSLTSSPTEATDQPR
jgi:hypothetical protein